MKCLLRLISNSQIFSSFRAIKFDQWGAVSSTEAWMLSAAELVELPGDSLEIVAEGSKNDRELSLLLFQENECSEEGWDQVILALAKHRHQKFLLFGQTSLLFFLSIIELILFIWLSFVVIFWFFVENWLTFLNFLNEISGVVQFLFCTFWQVKSFKHFFLLIFEFSAWTSSSSKAENSIFLNGFILFSIIVVIWVRFLKVFAVLNKVFGQD